MSQTLEQIVALAGRGEVKISDHGYDELAEDGIFVRDIVESLPDAELLEDYPDFPKGPCLLVLQEDRDGEPVHAAEMQVEGRFQLVDRIDLAGRGCGE